MRSPVFIATSLAILAFSGLVAAESIEPIKDPALEVAPAAVEPSSLSYSFTEGTLRAKDDRGDFWLLQLIETERWKSDQKTAFGPLLVGETLYFCVGSSLFEAAPADGTITRRQRLPGVCQGLKIQGQSVLVTTGDSSNKDGWTTRYSVAPGGSVPFFAFPSGSPGLGLWDRKQAEYLPVPHSEAEERKSYLAETKRRDEVNEAIKRYEDLAQRDPTNPWYDYYRAEALAAVGQAEAAKAAYQAVLSQPASSDYLLAALASRLTRHDPALGEQAWKRGMRALLAQGHEPELVTSLLPVMVIIDKPEREQMDPVADLAALELRASRLEDFSPHPEASASFFLAMQEAAEARGDQAAADSWAKKTDAARPYAVLAPMGSEVAFTGYLLNALMALMLALLAGFLIKACRVGFATFQTEAGWTRKLNPLSRWSRGELLGLLAGVGVCMWLSMRIATNVTLIGTSASMPLNMTMGNLGHPAAQHYMQDLVESEKTLAPEARFMVALGLQQAGDPNRAASIYEGLPFPRAKANLGTLKAARGDLKTATGLWEEALKMDPDLAVAAHNLGKPVDAARVARAKRFGIEGPLLAMPTVPMWEALFRAKVQLSNTSELSNPVSAFLGFGAFAVMDGGSNSLSIWQWFAIFLLILSGFAILGLATSFGRPPLKYTGFSKSAWVVGMLTPGLARQYSLVWPFISGALAYWIIGFLTLANSNQLSSSILDVIAMPAFNRYYGIGNPAFDPLKQSLDSLCTWPWLLGLLGLNVLLVLVAEKIWPDPAGSFAKKKS